MSSTPLPSNEITTNTPLNNSELPKFVPSQAIDSQQAVDEVIRTQGTKASKAVSDYKDLSQLIRAEGLLNKTVGFYIRKFITISALVIATWVGFLFLRESAFVLLLAPVLGMLTAQYGFLAHEAAHQQVFQSNKLNKYAGVMLADGFAGLAYGWWMVKHSKHHANPNVVKKDPDVGIRVLSFSPQSLKDKKGVEGWLARRQGWLFFPLLTLTAFDLLLDSSKALFSKSTKVEFRKTEILLLVGRQIVFPVILFVTLPWPFAILFYLISMMTFGVFLGGAFAPNHKGMPKLTSDVQIDFLRKQVLTSRNIVGRGKGIVLDNLMGGLNYQVEHHLFPSMPRPHLRRASEITKKYCEDRKIPYYQTSLVRSYGIVVRYLSDVGLAARDPFECPLANQLRVG